MCDHQIVSSDYQGEELFSGKKRPICSFIQNNHDHHNFTRRTENSIIADLNHFSLTSGITCPIDKFESSLECMIIVQNLLGD